MVVSKIDKTVHYAERKTINDEDKGYASSLFEIEILGKDVVIGLGREKHTYASTKNISYFPIYLVANNQIKSQIGVFEMRVNDVLKYIDDDGDLIIEELEPLLFQFVTPKFLAHSGSSPDFYMRTHPKDEPVKPIKKEDTSSSSSSDDDNNDTKRITTSKRNKEVSTTTYKTDVFEIDADRHMPDLLPEESEDEADEIVKKYEPTKSHNWVQRFMENTEFGLITNESGGARIDSILCVVRDAFNSIGHRTNIAKLRKLVATNISESVYEDLLDKYLTYKSELADIDKEMREMQKSAKIYKARIEKSVNKDEQRLIVQQAGAIKDKYKDLAITKKYADESMRDYAFMQNIGSYEEFQSAIEKGTINTLGNRNHAVISILESELNIKFIVFFKDAFVQGDKNAVLDCGQTASGANQKPKYYIMMTNGDNCELITYKSKRIFVFAELPYHVKTMIVNKCMERNAGSYNAISDVRNFQRKLGVKVPLDEDEDNADQTNKDIFVFSATAMNGKPGTLKGEKIEKSHLTEYRVLERASGWRRMLDDTYPAEFKLDGLRWKTVEHYYQAAKFKKQNPDFYKVFSLDSENDIAQSVEKAKEAGGKKGKLRPKNIKIDPDFYGMGTYEESRAYEERRAALMAKFNHNEDLRRVLMATKHAVLKHYEKGEPLKADTLLMKIRETVAK